MCQPDSTADTHDDCRADPNAHGAGDCNRNDDARGNSFDSRSGRHRRSRPSNTRPLQQEADSSPLARLRPMDAEEAAQAQRAAAVEEAG